MASEFECGKMVEYIAICPFCGSENLGTRYDGEESYIYCNDCAATGPYAGPDEIVGRWNMTIARHKAALLSMMGV